MQIRRFTCKYNLPNKKNKKLYGKSNGKDNFVIYRKHYLFKKNDEY